MTHHGGKFYATTYSGIYYCNKIGFDWKHFSSLYNWANEVFFINNTMFAQFNIRGNEYLLSTSDDGKNWDTICSKYTNVRHLRDHLFVSDSNGIRYSDDLGKSFHPLAYPAIDMNPYSGHISDSVDVKDSIISVSSSSSSLDFYLTTDGINASPIFDTAYVPSMPNNIFFAYDKGIVYILIGNKIIAYSTISGKITYPGELPAYGASNYNMVLQRSDSGYIYTTAYSMYIAKADSGRLRWQRQNIQSVNCIMPDGGILARSDLGNNVFFVNDSFHSIYNRGIPTGGIYLAQNRKDKIIASIRPNFFEINQQHPDTIRLLDTASFTYIPSLQYRHGNSLAKRSIMMYQGGFTYITNDSGYTWHLMTMPDAINQYSVLTYNDEDIFILKNQKDILASHNGGLTWFTADSGLDKTIFQYPYYLTRYEDSYLLLSRARLTNTYQAFKFDTAGGPLKPFANVLTLDHQFNLFDVVSTESGVPLALFNGPEVDRLYYLDTASLEWKISKCSGLSPFNDASALIIKDRIITSNAYGGLYMSDDLGNTFYKDSSFPSSLFVFNVGFNHAYIGNSLYISTMYGIWSNDWLYNSVPEPYKNEKAPAPHKNEKAPAPLQVQLKVFPNPASDHYSVSFPDSSGRDVYFQLNDITGRICNTYHSTTISGTNTFTFDRKTLRKGIYILRIKRGDDVETQKLVLE
jgi:hypothetical protein